MKITYFTFSLILMLFSSSLFFSPEKVKNEDEDFLISIEMIGNNEVQLVCTEGCAWETLRFTLSEKENDRLVNAYGLNDVEDKKNSSDLAPFLFSVQKSGNGLQLKGFKGTHWTDLNFSLRKDKTARVDRSGVTL